MKKVVYVVSGFYIYDDNNCYETDNISAEVYSDITTANKEALKLYDEYTQDRHWDEKTDLNEISDCFLNSYTAFNDETGSRVEIYCGMREVEIDIPTVKEPVIKLDSYSYEIGVLIGTYYRLNNAGINSKETSEGLKESIDTFISFVDCSKLEMNFVTEGIKAELNIDERLEPNYDEIVKGCLEEFNLLKKTYNVNFAVYSSIRVEANSEEEATQMLDGVAIKTALEDEVSSGNLEIGTIEMVKEQ